MTFVPLTQFSDHVSQYVREVRASEDVVVVTRHGRPAFCLYGVDEDERTGLVTGLGRFRDRKFERRAFTDEVSIRELSRSTFTRTRRFPESAEPTLVTYEGHPAAAMQKVDETTFQALAMSRSKEFSRNMQQADADFAAGRTQRLEEFLDELRGSDESRDAGASASSLADAGTSK